MVIKTGHSRLYRNRKDDGCLQAEVVGSCGGKYQRNLHGAQRVQLLDSLICKEAMELVDRHFSVVSAAKTRG